MLERYLIDQGKDFSTISSGVTRAYQRRYASFRSVALSSFVVASFVVPTLFAIEQARIITSSEALTVAALVVLLAALVLLPCLVIMVTLNLRFRHISTAVTNLESAWSYFVSAFRTETLSRIISGMQSPLDPGARNQLTKDYFDFSAVLDSAMRAWLIRVTSGFLRGYLDKDLKERYKAQISFMADRHNNFWSVMEQKTPRILDILAGNPDIKREVESYEAFVPETKK